MRGSVFVNKFQTPLGVMENVGKVGSYLSD